LFLKKTYIFKKVINITKVYHWVVVYHSLVDDYSKSVVHSKEKTCNNMPIHCPLCPKGQNDQPPTFWKYSFIPHMAECHLIDDKLPPLPEEFKMATYNGSCFYKQMPTFILFKDGKKVGEIVGADAGKLRVSCMYAVPLVGMKLTRSSRLSFRRD
jgi:hypothetical protein